MSESEAERDSSAELPALRAGSHPHHVRQWLLALSLFPEKWMNRLFSVRGIQFVDGVIRLRTFLHADVEKEPIYRLAKLPPGSTERAASVLFEDDWCLVLDKPSGMPVHPSAAGQRGTLDEAAARHCLMNGDPQSVKHIHRLDDDTSGPVLYAKNDLAQQRLDAAMRQKTIERHYAAIVQGKLLRRRGTIDEPIGKDRHHGARRRVSNTGDHAVTHYEVVEAYRTASLVRLQLETGRTHQIRVHMSHLGHPLVGDTLYGGSSRYLNHQALRGELLVFPHPLTGAPVTVAAPEPQWFAKVREELGAHKNS
ncbi:RluA family pseudouridine synthase [Paenibacillus oenotherae]|uniref:Pseudouridine synthase n=2 Tax=Paenibacillus oenotherae TaxID=1435645 RepID=A0ABS7D8K6_9BACL|nr:RluA family pseudouridine synthase [Paenibacillus oenotherae]